MKHLIKHKMIKNIVLKAFPKAKIYSKTVKKLVHTLYGHEKIIKTIIDVGANIGQFAYQVSRVYKDANIYSFEPVPGAFEELEKFTKNMKNIVLFNMCLGNKNDNIDFFVNNYNQASSPLPISENQKEIFPFTKISNKISVPVSRLDSLSKDMKLQHPVLLKLDVQGYEKEVLNGSTGCLDKIDFLLFETSFVKMYENEPLFDEMHSFVKDLGFELIAPVSTLRDNTSKIIQMDVLYRKIKS